jgi:hypothetical protein
MFQVNLNCGTQWKEPTRRAFNWKTKSGYTPNFAWALITSSTVQWFSRGRQILTCLQCVELRTFRISAWAQRCIRGPARQQRILIWIPSTQREPLSTSFSWFKAFSNTASLDRNESDEHTSDNFHSRERFCLIHLGIKIAFVSKCLPAQ